MLNDNFFLAKLRVRPTNKFYRRTLKLMIKINE